MIKTATNTVGQKVTLKKSGITVHVDSVDLEFTSAGGQRKVVVSGQRYSLAKKHFFGQRKAFTLDLDSDTISSAA